MTKKWHGSKPTVCDVCKEPFTTHFIDGVCSAGPRLTWALMCTDCFREYGVGLGTGRGQLYNLITLEKEKG